MTPVTPTERVACLLCGSSRFLPLLESRVQLAPNTGEGFQFVRCLECDLVYLNPRPTADALARFHPPAYLPHRGPEAWGRWAPLVRRAEARTDRARVRWVSRYLALGPDTPLLDVGCGRPSFLRAVLESTGAPAVGIDASAEGWRSEGASWAGIRLLEGMVEPSEERLRALHPEGYGVFTLWHLLEHAPDPVSLLRTLRRLGRSNARLMVEVPNLDSLTARQDGATWAGFHTPRHTAAYTPATLARILEVGGWRVEATFSYGTLDPFILRWLGREIRHGRGLEGSLEGHFPGFVARRIAWFPLLVLKRYISLGIQVAVGRAD